MLSRMLAPVVVLGSLALSTVADAKAPAGPPPFDRDAATRALNGVDLAKCKAPGGPRGAGHVLVTFSPEGAVTDVQVDRDPYKGNPVARCLVAQYKLAKVPAFAGAAVTVGKNFSI